MGRYFRYAWLLALALVCLIVAMANRAPVTLSLLPDDLAGLLNWQLRVELPLFLVLALGVVLGLALAGIFPTLLSTTADRVGHAAAGIGGSATAWQRQRGGSVTT